MQTYVAHCSSFNGRYWLPKDIYITVTGTSWPVAMAKAARLYKARLKELGKARGIATVRISLSRQKETKTCAN